MFAQYNGPQKVEEELLPQCWEQIGDKYMERRLLVVDACSALIPYMSVSNKPSLTYSSSHTAVIHHSTSSALMIVVLCCTWKLIGMHLRYANCVPFEYQYT